jgi:hypothetical protein
LTIKKTAATQGNTKGWQRNHLGIWNSLHLNADFPAVAIELAQKDGGVMLEKHVIELIHIEVTQRIMLYVGERNPQHMVIAAFGANQL